MMTIRVVMRRRVMRRIMIRRRAAIRIRKDKGKENGEW